MKLYVVLEYYSILQKKKRDKERYSQYKPK